MIAMCCQLPNTTMSATMTSADANPSPSIAHATSSNQAGTTEAATPTDAGLRFGSCREDSHKQTTIRDLEEAHQTGGGPFGLGDTPEMGRHEDISRHPRGTR